MTNYKETVVPDNKAPEDYTYNERRAELLQFIIEAGHPDRISRKKMGQRYDCDPTTITNDVQVLGEQIGELNEDAEMVMSALFRKALKEMAAQDRWKDAVEIGMDYQDWLFDTGKQAKEPDRLDITQDPGDAYLALMEEAEEREAAERRSDASE